ncbi:MAG: YraN family protein [Verrucomicrobiae bacterium]|nr:YraN family protein [Verrucomicrobiae bacterium]
MRLLARLREARERWLSPKATERQQRGAAGEAVAERFLRRAGFKILVRRYTCRYGEADLVARDADTLVFVEVKTRRSADFGSPAEAVTPEKQLHLSRVALHYLREIGHPRVPVRFDILEVNDALPKPSCRHLRDAFPLAEPYIY